MTEKLPINQYRALARLERHSIAVPTSVTSTTRAMNKLIERGLVERFNTDRETVFEYALTLDGKETLTQLDADTIPAEAPDTETLGDELPAFCRCADCNITLQSTESYRCEDCAIKLNPANSLEQRILRGASASAQFSKALSLTGVIGHADVMGLPREDFEQAFMQAGGIIYFDPETDAAPVDPTEPWYAKYLAQFAILGTLVVGAVAALNRWLEAAKVSAAGMTGI